MPHAGALGLLNLTLIRKGARDALGFMERVLQVLLALGLHVVSNLSKIVLLQSLIIDLDQGVPLDLLHAFL